MFNKEVKLVSNKKIYIFKIKNFFDDGLIEEIDQTFPVNKKSDLKLNFGKSSYLTNKSKVIEGSQHLKKFFDIVSSKEFFDFFTKKFFFKAAFQQDFLRMVKYLRMPKLNNKKSVFDFLFSKLRVDCEFSSIKNMGGIVPHVDGNRKYLSLMLYFPDKKYNDIQYGTTFWNSNVKNYSNTHLTDFDQALNFKKNNQVLLKTPFEKNVLYGFIKNNKSWHSVEPLNVSESYIRRSININFFVEN